MPKCPSQGPTTLRKPLENSGLTAEVQQRTGHPLRSGLPGARGAGQHLRLDPRFTDRPVREALDEVGARTNYLGYGLDHVNTPVMEADANVGDVPRAQDALGDEAVVKERIIVLWPRKNPPLVARIIGVSAATAKSCQELQGPCSDSPIAGQRRGRFRGPTRAGPSAA